MIENESLNKVKTNNVNVNNINKKINVTKLIIMLKIKHHILCNPSICMLNS